MKVCAKPRHHGDPLQTEALREPLVPAADTGCFACMSIAEVLMGFDLDASCFYTTGRGSGAFRGRAAP